MRNIHKNIAEKFEPQQWCVTEKKFALQTNKINETIFLSVMVFWECEAFWKKA